MKIFSLCICIYIICQLVQTTVFAIVLNELFFLFSLAVFGTWLVLNITIGFKAEAVFRSICGKSQAELSLQIWFSVVRLYFVFVLPIIGSIASTGNESIYADLAVTILVDSSTAFLMLMRVLFQRHLNAHSSAELLQHSTRRELFAFSLSCIGLLFFASTYCVYLSGYEASASVALTVFAFVYLFFLGLQLTIIIATLSKADWLAWLDMDGTRRRVEAGIISVESTNVQDSIMINNIETDDESSFRPSLQVDYNGTRPLLLCVSEEQALCEIRVSSTYTFSQLRRHIASHPKLTFLANRTFVFKVMEERRLLMQITLEDSVIDPQRSSIFISFSNSSDL